jgi:hypothetical protein
MLPTIRQITQNRCLLHSILFTTQFPATSHLASRLFLYKILQSLLLWRLFQSIYSFYLNPSCM